MILNGVMCLTLRYFNEFAKPAIRLITASSSIELEYGASTQSRQPKQMDCLISSFDSIRSTSEYSNLLCLMLKNKPSRIKPNLI